ncbi:MAG: site-specific integrase, partial [Anaerolineales bacterium]
MTDLVLVEPGDITIELQEKQLDIVLADALAGKNPQTKAKYRQRLRDFLKWRQKTGEPLSKALLGAYVEHLAGKGLAASTVNGHLTALRVMLREAADAGLIDELTYRRLSRVRVEAVASSRTGNWLGEKEAQADL